MFWLFLYCLPELLAPFVEWVGLVCFSTSVDIIHKFVANLLQVVISLLRLLLFVARPRTVVLGNLPNSMVYRNIEQYPIAGNVPGVLILEIDAPIYFANSSYLRERYLISQIGTFLSSTYEYWAIQFWDGFFGSFIWMWKLLCFRIMRWVDEEEDRIKASSESTLQFVVLDMSGKYWIFNCWNGQTCFLFDIVVSEFIFSSCWQHWYKWNKHVWRVEEDFRKKGIEGTVSHRRNFHFPAA